jgi:hypothetical protein
MFYCIVAHLSTITLSQLGEDAEVGVGFTIGGVHIIAMALLDM